MSLADVIAAHVHFWEDGCGCGWASSGTAVAADGEWAEWAAHLAAVIETAYACVELPEPEVTGKFDGGWYMVENPEDDPTRVWVQDCETGEEQPMVPETARLLAGALLAAAVRAERSGCLNDPR